ncbi:RNA-binding domain-containing protein [Basidiobolus meristosporus CBS 931.73]|uniref:RNA-binding domain-containing protein n=1 Tax=Basidiobolus meristosporus CBS 931.73 TaxID=1314790 RepID=A0A1Y1Z1B3_9FUNG|nr:RNA-binding domain-containing protein [Basidiobolus meristosporus CBS 931.73]|eukprot:ORY04081.1 RNA-binding domain-containing protein [Basidiobolus meristosporus CBS 931.73]
MDRRPQSPRRDEPSRRESIDEVNPGNNLFITGLSKLTREQDLEILFEKFGKVSKCEVVREPHSRESRRFAFVEMEKMEEAEAAIKAISGQDVHGRIITVEKARRSRPRDPTPGMYAGKPRPRRPERRYDPYPPPSYEPRYDRPPPREYERRSYSRDYDRYEREYSGGGSGRFDRPDRYDRYERYPRSYDSYDRYERPSRYDRYDDRERRPRYDYPPVGMPPRSRSPPPRSDRGYPERRSRSPRGDRGTYTDRRSRSPR